MPRYKSLALNSINNSKIAVSVVGRMQYINEILYMICFLEIQRSKTELISWFYLYSTPYCLCWQMLIAE